MHLGRWRLTR